MASKSVSLQKIIDEYSVPDEVILSVFYNVLGYQEISKYNDKLKQLFLFASENKELFTNIRVEENQPIEELLSEYIGKWISSYIKDRENDKLLNPLKNYGERDEALISRIRASTGASEDVMDRSFY